MSDNSSSQIVEIDPALCDGPNNNRTDYKYVEHLAATIKLQGQHTPVILYPHATGRYEIIAGHTRTMACAMLGIAVKAILRPDLDTPAKRYAYTLSENETRQDTNDIEKATGFRRAIDEHGYSVPELARQIGKRTDYIERRLSLLNLSAPYQEMIAKGQLPLGYGVAMSPLTPEYQYAAVTRMTEYTSKHGHGPDIHWFRLQCADLLSKQNQLGLFTFGAPIVESPEEIAAAIALPADPADYVPAYNPLALEESLAADLELWRNASTEWAQLGKADKAGQCAMIVKSINAFLVAMGKRSSAAALEEEHSMVAATIGRLLSDRGIMTSADLYRYSNMTRDAIRPVLEHMVRVGQVVEHKAGRGSRYSLAV